MSPVYCAAPKCPLAGGTPQRVECRRCKSHRDLTLAPRCMVCGAESFNPVEPTLGDRLAAADREVIAAAEAVNARMSNAEATDGDPSSRWLREACRTRALVLAGDPTP